MTTDRKIAFLRARWHAEIVDQAWEGFQETMAEQDAALQIDGFEVPGAFELPLLAQRLAQTGAYKAIVAAALVVDGGIYRHDFVAQAVVSGLMEAGLRTGVPVLSVSLTPHHFQPSEEHQAFFHAHFRKKGREAAEAALQIIAAHADLDRLARQSAA